MSDTGLIYGFAAVVAVWALGTIAAWHLLNRKARRDGEQRLADWRHRERHVLRRRVS